MKTKLIALGAASLLLFAVAACDDDEDPELAFCESLVTLTVAVDEARAIDAESSIDEYNAAVDKVIDAAAEVKDNAGDLAEEQVEAIEAAVDDLESYKGDLEGSEAVAGAVQGSAPYLAAIMEARAEAGTVNCAEAAAEEAAGE
jgi:hypothetical protein